MNEQVMFLSEYQPLDFQIINEGTEDKKYRIVGVVSRADVPNKNKRIYPRGILKEAVEGVRNAALKGGFVGELDHPCLISPKYQILTKDGWKEFVDINSEDEVATFNEDNVIEYQKIEGIINEPFKGKAYEVKGRNIDSAFTGAHRFYLENRYGKREVVTLKEIYDNRTKYNKHKILKIGKWIGNGKETVTIPAVPQEELNGSFKNLEKISKDLILNAKDFFAFMGIYLSEGNISHTRDENNRVYISQNEGLVADEIRELLSRLGFEFSENSRKRENSVGITFSFLEPRLKRFLAPLGNCYTKYIPAELKEYDEQYLEELLEWFVKGDGRDQRGMNNGNRVNVFSVSKRLVEDLHEILIKTGGSGNWTEQVSTEDYMFADHLIEAENKKTLYQLNFSTTKGIYLDERNLSIEEIDHDGNIYCITVPNGNFYMKQNGKAFLTGNSSPKINVERISHKITKIDMMEDGAVVAEMEVLDTPHGRILKQLINEGVHLGVSTRALGKVTPYRGPLGEGLVEVSSGLNLKAIDIVFEPSAGDDGRPNFFAESVEDLYAIEQFKKKTLTDVVKDVF